MTADIYLENETKIYRPGEPVSGMVRWHGRDQVREIELRLIYYTSGKGTSDVKTIAVEKFPRPGASESRSFELTAFGRHPWSFSGKLVSVVWGLELVFDDEELAAKCELIVSPTGAEIDLYAHDDGSAERESKFFGLDR